MKTEISKYGPCSEAVDFRNNYKSFKDAWDNCPRGDWMLWIASRLKVNIRQLTYAKALCAETVLHLMKDERSINAVKVAKRFGKYKASDSDLKSAYADAAAATDAAAAAAGATYAYAYAYAAAAAAAAADAAAAYAAAYATATSAAYATYATAAAYATAARTNNQLLTATICRKHLTKAVFKKLKITN